MAFGDLLKKYRGNITQESIANEIGINFRTISSWESGKSKPDKIETVLDLINTLIKNKCITNPAQANQLLASLDMRQLKTEEENKFFGIQQTHEKESSLPNVETTLVENALNSKDNSIYQSKIRRFVFVAVATIIICITIAVVLASSISQSSFVPIDRNQDWLPQFKTFNGIEMALVPPGCFNMGNITGRDNEKPVHQQCFTEPFWIGVTEVTQEQYGSPPDDKCNTNKITLEGFVNPIGPNYPRNCLPQIDALKFCQSLGMRLPTETEWEYSARGPDGFLYPWGNSADSAYAVVRSNSSNVDIMLPVGSKSQDVSWIGAKDMAGSLREYTSTIYDTVTLDGTIVYPYPYNATDGRENPINEGTSKADDPVLRATTTLRVLRGGSFDWLIDRATATFRHYEWYDFVWNDRGFRCAKDWSDTDK